MVRSDARRAFARDSARRPTRRRAPSLLSPPPLSFRARHATTTTDRRSSSRSTTSSGRSARAGRARSARRSWARCRGRARSRSPSSSSTRSGSGGATSATTARARSPRWWLATVTRRDDHLRAGRSSPRLRLDATPLARHRAELLRLGGADVAISYMEVRRARAREGGGERSLARACRAPSRDEARHARVVAAHLSRRADGGHSPQPLAETRARESVIFRWITRPQHLFLVARRAPPRMTTAWRLPPPRPSCVPPRAWQPCDQLLDNNVGARGALALGRSLRCRTTRELPARARRVDCARLVPAEGAVLCSSMLQLVHAELSLARPCAVAASARTSRSRRCGSTTTRRSTRRCGCCGGDDDVYCKECASSQRRRVTVA